MSLATLFGFCSLDLWGGLTADIAGAADGQARPPRAVSATMVEEGSLGDDGPGG